MSADDSVTQWLDRLRVGDQEAAGRLWERYFPHLLTVARSRLHGFPRQSADEEDVALSAFHAFCQAAAGDRVRDVRGRDDVKRTLVLITVGKAVDQWRRHFSQKRGGGRGAVGAVAGDPGGPADLAAIAGREPDPALAAQLTDELAALLRRLPDDDLRQLALLKLDGYTNDEIAARTGRSLRSITRRLVIVRRSWEGSIPPAG